MSSGMNMAEAKEIAKKMSYRDAVNNALRGRCVPYKKATRIKLNELLEMLDKGLTVTEFADRCRECGAKYGKQKIILDKIRAEIMSKDGLEEALDIIDKYKESEVRNDNFFKESAKDS